MNRYILFGAGTYAKKSIELLGKDNIEVILDNDSRKWGTQIEGIPVCKPDKKGNVLEECPVVISVSRKYQSQIAEQLKQWDIKSVKTIQDIQIEFTKKKIQNRVDYIKIYDKAIRWIKNNTINNHAIICNTNKIKGYPEVTGYYIPTLLKWGYRELAISYAEWLCDIQKENGSWFDTDDKAPYVFDTAQILKGLLAVREQYPHGIVHIKKGCDWILKNVQASGRLTTPSKDAWGNKGVCSELIHLYCLSPLVEAADILHMPQYKEDAYKILNYYKAYHYDEIMNFGLLSHFYAYVMEGLLDMGERSMVAEAMEKVGKLQKENGAVPAYRNVDWVCSTGLFQFALIWFRLGDIEKGNKAFEYACKLQNESGGWYGSYLSEVNSKEDNDYFPSSEISWAVKYFLDALYYKNIAEFNLWADLFLDKIDYKDGRYQIIKGYVFKEHRLKNSSLRILDAGCGKGRYLQRLIEDEPENDYYAMDLSEKVLNYITAEQICKKQGTLTNIDYPDNYFDITYTCEALEHAIDIESAIKELARVTKPGGKVIVIDKNKKELGRMEINPWEIWFDSEELKGLMLDYCSDVDVIDNIDYEDKKEDPLFLAWIGTVGKKE